MELRFYSFINFYLSPIQQGIQTAHLVHEMFNKYPFQSGTASAHTRLMEWSLNHKTIIVLNAGVDADIQDLMNEFPKMDFPFVEFREDAGLCGARTGCGVVLPEYIFNARRMLDGNGAEVFTWISDDPELDRTYREGDPHFNFLKLLKSKRLA